MNTDLIQNQPEPHCYLGDGAYARFDGLDLILTAENGVEVLHRIVLEPAVWTALKAFVERTQSPKGEPAELTGGALQLLESYRSRVSLGQEMEGWILKHSKVISQLASLGIEPSPYGSGLDFDHLTHPQIMEVIKAFPGQWKKELNGSMNDRIDYSSMFDGKPLRCWAGEPPPSCRIVEVEEIVPAQPERKKMVRKLECNPAVEAVQV